MCKDRARAFTVTIEPHQGCNLQCRYCYSDNQRCGVMRPELLELSLRKVVRHAEGHGFDEIHFVWHGGEPLLAGVGFFERILDILDRLGCSLLYRHFIQTNGLLLDDTFCSFFRDAGFEVGVSLDGPPDIHNRFRVDRNGRGTHKAVLKAIQLLEDHQVPVGFNIVISRASLGHERRIYEFFKDLGYGFRANPMISPRDAGSAGRFLLRGGEYGKFLCILFDLWIDTGEVGFRVSPLDIYFRSLLEDEPTECRHKFSCFENHLGIKQSGEVVLCATFQDLAIGNIRDATIDEILAGHTSQNLKRRSETLAGCKSCSYWKLCHGGCPANSCSLHGDPMEKDPFCKDYRIVFDHLRRVMEMSCIMGRTKAVQ